MRAAGDVGTADEASVGALLGEPAAHAGFVFQAAELKLAPERGPLEFLLCEFAGAAKGGPPAALQLAFEKQYDAAWVRARLPRVFGFTPEFVEEVESALLDVGFIATAEDGRTMAFVCADVHGRAGLRFPAAPTEESSGRRRAAEAFWSLLLLDADELADFEQMVYHEPADVWLKMGCLHAQLFCEQSED